MMQFSTMREETRDYVTLALPALQQTPVKPTRSWRRRWNQLSRLQRGILSMMGLAIIVALIYFHANPIHATISTASPVPQSEKINDKAGRVVEEPPAAGGIGNGDEGGGGGGGGGMSISKDEEVNQIKKVQLDNSIQADEGDKDDLAHQIAPPPGPRTRRNPKQEAVVAAMQHAWQGYKNNAWGSDHLKPVTGGRNEWLHLGLTLIDALDTLWIMDLKEEFNQAREWVATEFTLNLNQEVNLFETTIRVLGGLLSTYHLSKDNLFLEKAIDLGDRLLPCFDSPSGIPYSDVNLMTRRASKPKWGPDSSTSEVTTIQLELRDLSRITGVPIYEEKADFVTQHIHKLPKTEGLVPIFINAASGQWRPHATITLGARGDSYYEYLLKQWVQTGRTRDTLRDDFNESVSGMEHLLARRSEPNKLLFFGELHGGGKNFVNKMDELTCYLPGTLVLGVHFGMPKHHLDIAKDLLYTCVQTWLQQPTHLAPEITYFNTLPTSTEDLFVKSNDAHYLLRPETIESLWYMYHFTGNKTYQDWGWQIFQGIEKYCKTEHGYTSIGNVRSVVDVKPRDKMESFFLGETLKYFYLLFSDDQKTYSLDKWVFNSEAHLFPLYDH